MKKKKLLLFYMISILSVIALVVIDQFTKHLAVIHLKDKPSFPIWKEVFCLQYLENKGAAFGMMQDQLLFFLLITSVILIGILILYIYLPKTKRFLYLHLVLLFICAGAVGNLIDRVKLGYVVDFLYFELIDFPIFNVADIYVTVSAFVLGFLILFYYKEEELNEIFKRKRKNGKNSSDR